MAISDGECRSIAKARFTLTRDGRFPTQEKLAQDFKRDPGVIGDAVLTAFRKKLVKLVSVTHPPIPCDRSKTLEDRLKRKYHLVPSVVVMDTAHLKFEGPQRDDEIHHILGHETARIIAEGWLFRSGDTIGVGSGRGVYYTVDALSVMDPLFLEGIKVVSLTGSVEARDHMATVSDHMDADLHAVNLMRCFSGATAVFIDATITPANTHQTILAPDRWKQHHPNQALVGLGVLAQGHRFFEEVDHPHDDSILSALREDLETLIECCKHIEQHVQVANYCAVGDVCHQLFFITPPPGGKPIGDGLRDNIEGLIRQINARTLTVSEEQLQSIDNITLIAGGARKAFAIMELLHSPKYRVRCLCTDSSAAELILNSPPNGQS